MQTNLDKTPHLKTALTGPLYLLEKQILTQKDDIEKWFNAQWEKTPAPVYGSVDLRNAGFKLAPVDMNLFPAGFNNLNPEFIPLSIEAAKLAITNVVPLAKKILLIPENHTRNLYYWSNIKNLLNVLGLAGFDVCIGTLLSDYAESGTIKLQDNTEIKIETITRKNNKLYLKNFEPDVILLNNDLSEGIPEILKNLDQVMLPPAELGWNQRSKSEHFKHYANVCEEFSKLISIDSWLIAPLFTDCENINFMLSEGVDEIALQAEKMLMAIQLKYDEYKIDYKPYVVIKADAGTYGIAVMMAKSVDDVRSLNRKQRTSMSKSKGGQAVDRVIVQEGVYTFETWGPNNAVAEPVVYMWGERVVGGFYRVHKERGIDENLNAPGMHFEPLAFARPCNKPVINPKPNECNNRFYAYGVIARLSMLAAAREMQALNRNNKTNKG